MHVPLHVTSYSKGFAANHTRMGLLTRVYTTMILQVAARSERFVTVLAAVILFTSVNTPVHDQRILPRKLLGTVFALVLFLFRVNARRVVF